VRNSSSLFSSDCKSRLKFAHGNTAASVAEPALGLLPSVLSRRDADNSREPARQVWGRCDTGVSVLLVRRFCAQISSTRSTFIVRCNRCALLSS